MKAVIIVLFFLVLIIKLPIYSQDNAVLPQRTPEQEAVKQTEKLQQELNLSSEQAKQIYDINLRYARERLISNKRSEGLERAKNKNAEVQRILTAEQNERLQSKRFERTSIERQIIDRNQQVNSSGFRSNNDFRSNQSDLNLRSNNRPVNANFQNKNQTDRPIRNVVPTYRSTRNQANPYTNRTSSGNSTNTSTRKSDNPNQSNASPKRSQPVRSNEPKREAPTRSQRVSPAINQTTRQPTAPVNTNRK